MVSPLPYLLHDARTALQVPYPHPSLHSLPSLSHPISEFTFGFAASEHERKNLDDYYPTLYRCAVEKSHRTFYELSDGADRIVFG